jgi:hypothetical protein
MFVYTGLKENVSCCGIADNVDDTKILNGRIDKVKEKTPELY